MLVATLICCVQWVYQLLYIDNQFSIGNLWDPTAILMEQSVLAEIL